MNPMAHQFGIWRRNMYIPLTDQLEEQAKRKMAKIEEERIRDQEKDQVFRQRGDDTGLHDLDSQ